MFVQVFVAVYYMKSSITRLDSNDRQLELSIIFQCLILFIFIPGFFLCGLSNERDYGWRTLHAPYFFVEINSFSISNEKLKKQKMGFQIQKKG